jgi:hypothetical protein
MPSRLTVLALIGLIGLAGCTGGPGTQPTDTGQPTPTTATTLTAEPVTFPEGPKSKPERPEELSNATVRRYVHEMESRIAYNSLWRGNYSQVRVDCTVEQVTKDGRGYEAIVSCSGYNQIEPPENTTATSGPVYDYEGASRYFVIENVTRRNYFGTR